MPGIIAAVTLLKLIAEPVATREPTPATQPSQEFMAAFQRLERTRAAHSK